MSCPKKATEKLAILAEDTSDVETLKAIIRTALAAPNLSIAGKGYDGHSNMRKKGARDIDTWSKRGIPNFLICHDSDANDPTTVETTVKTEMVSKCGGANCIIAIPTQEIEAWLIADEAAIAKALPNLTIKPQASPERIASPKEWLVKQSRGSNGKPIYSPATFNPRIATHVNVGTIKTKCPSFALFLTRLQGLGLTPPPPQASPQSGPASGSTVTGPQQTQPPSTPPQA